MREENIYTFLDFEHFHGILQHREQIYVVELNLTVGAGGQDSETGYLCCRTTTDLAMLR